MQKEKHEKESRERNKVNEDYRALRDEVREAISQSMIKHRKEMEQVH